jgi:3-dehydroquinate synthase
MKADDFMRLMVRDKKVLDGQLRLVLMKSLGSAFVSHQFSVADLDAMLNQACVSV